MLVLLHICTKCVVDSVDVLPLEIWPFPTCIAIQYTYHNFTLSVQFFTFAYWKLWLNPCKRFLFYPSRLCFLNGFCSKHKPCIFLDSFANFLWPLLNVVLPATKNLFPPTSLFSLSAHPRVRRGITVVFAICTVYQDKSWLFEERLWVWVNMLTGLWADNPCPGHCISNTSYLYVPF